MLLLHLFRFELFILKGAHGSMLPSKNSKCQTLPVSMTMFYGVKMYTFAPPLNAQRSALLFTLCSADGHQFLERFHELLNSTLNKFSPP